MNREELNEKVKIHLMKVYEGLSAYQRNYALLAAVVAIDENVKNRYDLFVKSGKMEREADMKYQMSSLGEKMFYEDFMFDFYAQILTKKQIAQEINVFDVKPLDGIEIQKIKEAERQYRELQIYEQI